jgi:tetratricopeptide (TPR) repeat protein
MIGRTISHYRILSQLGSGGMGVVYEAEDLRLGRHVALKLLPADAGADPQAMQRFLREARIVSTLNHPHICTLHDIGDHQGQQFMVMELLEGESLKQRISRGPLPVDDTLDLGVQIADALDAAHAAGVIHRDIKPANLFVTKRGQAKVLDFGVAKLADAGADERADLANTVAASERTTVGSTVGTVAYMSPEQARGQELDARSDLFSFCEVLYEMATGTPAFDGPTPAVIFEGILAKQPEPASQLNGDLPPDFDRIVNKALEKDRDTRYQSAAEMRADLKRLKRETETGRSAVASVAAAPASAPGGSAPAAPHVVTRGPAIPPAARANRRRMLLIGGPLLMLAGVAAFVMWQSQRTPALTERDTVVLADFRNRTGDTMFDGTLSEALAVQLRQSPFLKLLPEQQVQMTLRQMGREPMEPMTSEIAREVCVRSAAKAMLGGTIANIGNSYLVTLSAQDCASGNILIEEQVRADGKDNVITALGTAASSFRGKLGESLASVQRYDQSIEQATTRSLDALKSYSQGMTTRRTQGDFESVPFFRRAVELDAEFALAHARLGTVLSNLGESDEAAQAATRAYELRGRVSERERLYIEARYYSTVDRNLDKAIEAYRVLLATYPDDYAAHSNIGALYRQTGSAKEALQHLEEAVRLAPMQPFGHLNLGGAYVDEGRLADARREFEEVLKLQESIGARTSLVVVGTLMQDQALVDAQVAAAKGPRAEVDMIGVRAQAAGFKGQMKESARLAEEGLRLAKDLNRLPQASEALLGLAINQASTGRREAARLEMERLLKAGPLAEAASDEMLALGALLGDRAIIDAYFDRTVKRLKEQSRAEDAPRTERAMRAIAAYGQGRYQEAYELGVSNGTGVSQAGLIFLAGLSALHLQRWEDAAKLFDTVVGYGARTGLSTRQVIAHVMRGRAYAGLGRTAEARRAYDEVFRLWKDADPDMPLLIEVRQEYQRIGS